MKETIQIRQAPTIRQNQNQQTLTGYAAVFYRADDAGTQFELASGIVERIIPGAFDLARQDDVVALYSHNLDQPLGRLSAGTLRLSVDLIGLKYDVDLPATQTGRDVAESVQRGDITGSSFGFTVPPGGAVTTRGEDGEMVRELRKIDLIEVSPVVFPAYDATAAVMRAANGEDILSHYHWQQRQQRARLIVAEQL